VFLWVCGLASGWAQLRDSGIISGVVVDSVQGEPVPGVVVSVRGTTLGTKTDEQGRYTIPDVPPGDHILIFSKSGFDRATVADVRVLMGQTSRADGRISPEFYEMDTYEVVAELVDDQYGQILFDRQYASSITHSIGSEMMSRLGSSDAADAVTKVSGTTVVEGKYAVVRGLNDRYVPTVMNGAFVPSSDPYRRAASLDQFPTAIIDEVAITKTFTPDQPGDFTGGGVDVVTRQFPEKPFVNFKIGAAYNTQSTGNDDFLSYDGGSTDWLGIDDGTRAIPDDLLPGNAVPPARSVTPPPTIPDYNQLVNEANTLNSQTLSLGTAQFEPTGSAPPPDQKFGVSSGGTFDVLGQELGVLGALDYRHEFRYSPNGTQARYQGTDQIEADYQDRRSLTTVSWAGMASVGVRLWEHHQVGVSFLYSQTAQNTARIQTGTNYVGSPDLITVQDKIQWLQRNLTTLQVQGNSVFTELNNFEVDYLLAGTSTTQEEPDTRLFNYVIEGANGATGGNFLPNPQDPTRYFSDLEEDGRQAKVDLTLPFTQWTGEEAKVKGGVNYATSERDFWERNLRYPYLSSTPWAGGDPNTYLTDDNLGYNPTPIGGNRIRWNWQRYIQAFDSSYQGSRTIPAAYLMTDFPVLDPLRLVGGVRVEQTQLQIDSQSYLPNSWTGTRDNSTSLDQTDWLPSVGLVWSVRDNMTIRASYSQTIARPSFRELAAYRSYDPNLDTTLEGNPTLQITSIDNYDLSWDWFPYPSSIVGVGLFYKTLSQPIEQYFISVDGSILSWANRDSADVMGVEFELRQRLDIISPALADFSLGGNFSLIQSSTDLTARELELKSTFIPDVSDTRPLSEQSPYILNLDASYDNPDWGTTLSIVYNVAGPRLLAAALNTDDIYEQSTPQLDFIASQRLYKELFLKFNVKNILNPVKELTYGKDTGLIFSTYTTGVTFQLGLDWTF